MRLAKIIFWLARGITLFLIIASILTASTGHPDIIVIDVLAAFALLVWLVALAVRYVVR
ncbi:MAG TPA: hypothetical protein VLX09_00030 [Stellaceae bacterium]|nr:hypothetical protein [Stellaceae bacterium]